MSVLPRSLRACASTSRAFSTASAAYAPKAAPKFARKFEWDTEIDAGNFGDERAGVTELGWLRLQQIEETRDLVSRTERDRAALQAQVRSFKPPTGKIRVTSQLDVAEPEGPFSKKRVLIAPVSALPLKGTEAVQRLKVLAGPRWTPGRPGRGEMGPEAYGTLAKAHEQDADGQDGYVKISEERYPDGRMNRKSVSDMLQRLVEAANDPKSPLPADTPVDPRHLLARQSKNKTQSQTRFARAQALKRRPEVVGGVRGFPTEWLAPDARGKVDA